MKPAFLTPTSLPLRHGASAVARSPRRAPAVATPRMCDDLTPAERTRRALAVSDSRVKFKRTIVEELPEDSEFKYQSGTTPGGFDVWLIIGVLTFLVPLALFAYGVATGNIDTNPR